MAKPLRIEYAGASIMLPPGPIRRKTYHERRRRVNREVEELESRFKAP